MAKIKINIKNTQIAQAVNLGGIKEKLAKKKVEPEAPKPAPTKAKSTPATPPPVVEEKEEPAAPRKARSKSAFAESHDSSMQESVHAEPVEPEVEPVSAAEPVSAPESDQVQTVASVEPPKPAEPVTPPPAPRPLTPPAPAPRPAPKPVARPLPNYEQPKPRPAYTPPPGPPRERLGPTGKHIKDLLPPPKPPRPAHTPGQGHGHGQGERRHDGPRHHGPRPQTTPNIPPKEDTSKKKLKTESGPVTETDEEIKKKAKFKEFRDLKPAPRKQESGRFDGRDRQGLRVSDDDNGYRKKRKHHREAIIEETTIRPTSLKVRLPTTIKDLASEMKLKASELVSKLFLQGMVVTLNSILDDETTVQLLGHEFGCAITIDTTEEERIRITDKTIKEEITAGNPDELQIRPPVVAFMGHVDHGKTSLIDAIRKSNRAAGEAGAITQHIGAFKCSTAVGDIAILDTPGHEAFSAMRARGADVTDIVVLVVAGDEGIRQQTQEAIQHAKAAKVTIVVAINKSDKPNFNPENVYRQLSEMELLPEAWGGQTITVNCSAVTGEGIPQLLEMLALQAEVLELRANPLSRPRGAVIESEMHKGMGAVTTVLVQNGTLRLGDSIVFGEHWGRVKTMRDEHGRDLKEAGPSTPVEITGLSGLPGAGQDFIGVKNEKEAREISEARVQDQRLMNFQMKKKITMDNLLQQASDSTKKILNIVLRADVQGSLEALKVALMKIESTKAELNIIFAGVGEVSESDVQLAAASKAVVIGFHTQIESHADALVKETGVRVKLHDIIYHAIDDVKDIMSGLLDKIAIETDKGKALVKATFKSSRVGIIAGCQVIDGTITRNNHVRVMRDGVQLWRGPISSLKRVKEDVREVSKGLECGILLHGFSELKDGDTLEAFEITYISQEL